MTLEELNVFCEEMYKRLESAHSSRLLVNTLQARLISARLSSAFVDSEEALRMASLAYCRTDELLS